MENKITTKSYNTTNTNKQHKTNRTQTETQINETTGIITHTSIHTNNVLFVVVRCLKFVSICFCILYELFYFENDLCQFESDLYDCSHCCCVVLCLYALCMICFYLCMICVMCLIFVVYDLSMHCKFCIIFVRCV